MVGRKTINKWHQEDLERIKGFRLLDDEFFTKCFEENALCVELILHIILDKPDLKVIEVRTQVLAENLLKRSVRFDVLATDSLGSKYNIEIQRADRGAVAKRARYNSSMTDASVLKKGEDFDALPETFVIFITENDVIGENEPLYQVERCFIKSGKPFCDGTHICYVNGAFRGETPLGKLMHDFSCTNPHDMHYTELADMVSFFKESKEGVVIMSKVIEDMRNEALQEGIKEGIEKGEAKGIASVALRMLKAGKFALEDIASMTGLSLDEVKKLGMADIS